YFLCLPTKGASARARAASSCVRSSAASSRSRSSGCSLRNARRLYSPWPAREYNSRSSRVVLLGRGGMRVVRDRLGHVEVRTDRRHGQVPLRHPLDEGEIGVPLHVPFEPAS